MHAYEEAAVRAARQAGELIRARLGQARRVDTKSGARDLVTEVDRASEAAILGTLREAFPQVPILGEEGVSGAGAPTVADELDALPELWAVDPLDGTTNFVHGWPFVAVSIAYARRGELLVGVVYDPFRDELFTARAGAGARLNGEPVQVDGCRRLADAMLATGFSPDPEWRRCNVEGLRALAPHVRTLRAAGSAALHLAWTACGRLSGFWENQLSPWDMAAGALLVREAGGRVTDTIGRPYRLATRHIAATSGAIHDELLYFLHEAGCTGFTGSD